MYNTPSRSPFLDNQNNHNCTGDSSQKTRHHRRCTKVCIPATANCKGSGKHLRKEPDDAPPESNEDMGNGETNPHKNVAEDSGTKVCRELDSNCTEKHNATSNGDNNSNKAIKRTFQLERNPGKNHGSKQVDQQNNHGCTSQSYV